MPDLPNSMTETTEDCSSHDNIFAIFSNLDSDLRPLDPSSPDELVRPSSAAVSTDSEVMFISPPTSPLMLLPNQISNDEPVSPDSTSTVEASDSDPAVEASPTAGVQFADGTNEYQHELPPAYSFPTDCTPFFRAPISLSTAPRLLIQYITTNIAATLLFRNRQQLSDHGSTPNFAMAWNPSSTLGKLSIGTTNGKNWLFRIQLCLPNASRFPKELLLPFLI